MKRLFTCTAAVALSALTFAGSAHAATWFGNALTQSQVNQAVESLKNQKFSIVRLDSLDKTDRMYDEYVLHIDERADQIKRVQEAIAKNPKLVAELKSQNVEINNIAAVEEAMDGSFIFYLR